MAKNNLLGITEVVTVDMHASPEMLNVTVQTYEVDEKPKQLWQKKDPNASRYVSHHRWDKGDLGRIKFGFVGDSVYGIRRSAVCLPHDVARVKREMHDQMLAQIGGLLEAAYELKDQLLHSKEAADHELIPVGEVKG